MAEQLYKMIQDYSGEGAMPFLLSIRDAVPLAFPILLLAIFAIIFSSNLYINQQRTGRAKVLLAVASSSFIMVILSMFLFLSQLISYRTILFWLLCSVLSFIAVVFSD